MSKSKGFTLIELMVTISIIAILAAIGLVFYSYVIKQGQDSKRQSDLRTIQSALEEFYSDNLYYPVLEEATCGNGSFKIGCALKSPDGTKTYIQTIPSATTGSYTYIAVSGSSPTYGYNVCDNSTTNCASYCLYTKLENGNSDTNTTPASRTDACYSADTAYNFVISPP